MKWLEYLSKDWLTTSLTRTPLALLCLLSCLWVSQAYADRGEQMQQRYQQAIQAFQRGQLAQAKRHFRQVLPYLRQLEKSKKAGSQAAHLAILGQCDVLYHLGSIARRKGQERRACRYYQTLKRRLTQVPAGWQKWGVQPNLPGRIKRGTTAFNTCHRVSTMLSIRTRPAGARVSHWRNGRWLGVDAQRPLAVKGKEVRLRVEAPGYQTQERRIQLKVWEANTATFVLKRPLIGKPTPPVGTPLYKKWWLWTTVGIVVAGGVTAAILVVTAQPREVLGQDGATSFPLH